jgi:hypothetical protein
LAAAANFSTQAKKLTKTNKVEENPRDPAILKSTMKQKQDTATGTLCQTR